jgi:hypothetical protein
VVVLCCQRQHRQGHFTMQHLVKQLRNKDIGGECNVDGLGRIGEGKNDFVQQYTIDIQSPLIKQLLYLPCLTNNIW